MMHHVSALGYYWKISGSTTAETLVKTRCIVSLLWATTNDNQITTKQNATMDKG